jgi:hypothetical protein
MNITRRVAIWALTLVVAPTASLAAVASSSTTTLAACGIYTQSPPTAQGLVYGVLQSPATPVSFWHGCVSYGAAWPSQSGSQSIDAPATANAADLISATATVKVTQTQILVQYTGDMTKDCTPCAGVGGFDFGPWKTNYMDSGSTATSAGFQTSAVRGATQWSHYLQSCSYYNSSWTCYVGITPQQTYATTWGT